MLATQCSTGLCRSRLSLAFSVTKGRFVLRNAVFEGEGGSVDASASVDRGWRQRVERDSAP
ncbi:MAG: hypothetical protein R3D29_14075 [Nitratireductor sp.]